MDILRRAFYDISMGYTRGTIFDRTVYVKHLSYADQINNDTKREEFYQQALSQGLFTNEKKLLELNKEGLWTDKNDKELMGCKSMINELLEGKKKNVNMPSLVNNYNTMIKKEEDKLIEILANKNRLLGLTCEYHADRELGDYYIYTNLFSDKDMIIPFFGSDEFDYLSEDIMGHLTLTYNNVMEGCSDLNIKKLAMQGFFQNYFGLVGDNLGQFFGKPIASLTFFQVRLITFGAHFRHIYSTHDVSKFPPNIRDDPDLLSDYATAITKGKDDMEKQGAYDQDAIVVGMKKEDSAALGIKSKNTLASDIAKSGGNIIDWAMKR